MTSLSEPDEVIPVTHLNEQTIPAQYLFEAWQQATYPLFDVEPLQAPSSYYCATTSYRVDQLVFTQTAFNKMQFIRPAEKLSGAESDCIVLQYYATGCIQGSLANGTPLIMEPNRISIQDFAYAYSGIGETTNNFGIVIPRHLITTHDQIYREQPMFSWPIASLQGRLLLSTLNSLWQVLPILTAAEAPIVAAGLLGLLNGLLSTKWDESTHQSVQQATLKAMQDYIQKNLKQADLGVDQLCSTFHCSRSSVYRLFQPLGGVKGYIKNQRLIACFNELRHLNPTSSQKISDIAAQWGFNNMSHFNRLFKQLFDMTPSEAKELNTISATVASQSISGQWEDVDKLRQWLEQY